MVLWTIFVQDTRDEIHEFEIDKNETVGTLRRKVAEALKMPINDLVLVSQDELSRLFDSKKLSEINGIFDGCTLLAVPEVCGGGGPFTIWTIFVQLNGELHEFKIDNNETFGTLRRKIAETLNMHINDLLLVSSKDYCRKFDSKKLSEIEGIDDGVTLYAVYQVG